MTVRQRIRGDAFDSRCHVAVVHEGLLRKVRVAAFSQGESRAHDRLHLHLDGVDEVVKLRADTMIEVEIPEPVSLLPDDPAERLEQAIGDIERDAYIAGYRAGANTQARRRLATHGAAEADYHRWREAGRPTR
jgi:hypothetical protein